MAAALELDPLVAGEQSGSIPDLLPLPDHDQHVPGIESEVRVGGSDVVLAAAQRENERPRARTQRGVRDRLTDGGRMRAA